MTYDKFSQIIDSLKQNSDTIHELYKMNVDLINFVDPYENVIADLIKEIYGEEGYDWFSWFVNEIDETKTNKENPRAWDKEDNPICYDRKSLWQYLEGQKAEARSSL
jgi:hypothetical protein